MEEFYVSDSGVARVWGERLGPLRFVFEAGEGSKTRRVKGEIEDFMLEQGLSRGTRIVAVGGGVTLDLAGFVAATFARGIDWVAVPTTLLAMVDASIGGKVGVNARGIKNMIGAFHPPVEVRLDLDFLKTLPGREMRNGWAEILKYGFICDPNMLEEYDLGRLIARSRAIKEAIVREDPYEKGMRAILNFGHTVGHALETVSAYQISHGEAVAIGMAVEAEMSYQRGFLSKDEVSIIRERLERAGFDLTFRYDIDRLFAAMQLDKKGGMLLLKKIGEADHTIYPIDRELLCAACCAFHPVD